MKNIWRKTVKGVFATSLIAGSIIITTPLLVNNKNIKYHKANDTNDEEKNSFVPLDIISGYNCSSIVAATTTSTKTETVPNIYNISPVDAPSTDPLKTLLTTEATDHHRSALFVRSFAKSSTYGSGQTSDLKGFGDPVDGYVTLTSANQPAGATGQLYWKIPVSTTTAQNNTMKLWDADGHKTGTFTFNNAGVYKKMYALCIVSNVPEGSKSSPVKVEMTINYTDGTTKAEQYNLYDWCYNGTASTLKASTGADHNRALIHMTGSGLSSSDPIKWNDELGSTTSIIMNQCGIDVETNKKVASVNMELKTSYSTGDKITLTVFGITGQVDSNILEPVSIKTQKTKGDDKQYHYYITWKDQEGQNPSHYYIDMWTEDAEGNKTLLEKYNNKEILATSEVGQAHQIEVTDDLAKDGTKYHVHMRAGNGVTQSADSNEDYIITDIGCPISITCDVVDPNLENAKKFTISPNKPGCLKTIVTNDTGATSYDQGVVWEIDDKYKDCIKIEEDTTRSQEHSNKYWKITSTKPINMAEGETIKAIPHADLATEPDKISGTVKPDSVEPETNAGIKEATISWKNPESTKSYSDNYYFNVVIKDTNGTLISESKVNYDSSGTTTTTITGLSPDTNYVATVTTVYYETESNAEAIKSDEASINFKTSYNEANKIILDASSVTLTLGGTEEAVVKSTVKGSDGNNATYQKVEWTSSDDSVEITSESAEQEKPTSHTFKAKHATESAKTYTATTTESSTVSKNISVKVNVAGVNTIEPENIKPDSFTAKWQEGIRKDNTPWVDGYIITLYDASDKQVGDPIKIDDPKKTSHTFKNLSHNTTYSYTVKAVNNYVSSSESVKRQVTTATSLPTKVEVKKGEEELAEGDKLDVLVGTQIDLTSKVIGQTFDDVEYDATDQKVTTNLGPKPDGIVEAADSDNNHKIKVKNTGTTAIGLKAYSTGVSGEIVETTIQINSLPLNLEGCENITKTGFTITWTSLADYAIDKTKLKYVFDVATDKDFKQMVHSGVEVAADKTSLDIAGLDKNTTYYYRAKYVYNDVSSPYTSVQQVTTNDDIITNFSLNKSEITIIGNRIDETLVLTSNSDISYLDAEWEMSDKSICNITKSEATGTEWIRTHNFNIQGSNSGKTVLSVKPKGIDGFTQTCTINVVKGQLDPIKPEARDITKTSFELYWHPIADWSGKPVNYKVNVWYKDGSKNQYILKDYVTSNTNVLLDEKTKLIPNKTYYCTIDAFNNNYETVTNEILEVKLIPLFAWWKVWTILGSIVGGSIVVPAALYILWKNNLLVTIDPKKAKSKLANKKNNIIDKFFRVLDKYYVMWNQIVRKKNDTLYSKLGTRKEQQLEDLENLNKK